MRSNSFQRVHFIRVDHQVELNILSDKGIDQFGSVLEVHVIFKKFDKKEIFLECKILRNLLITKLKIAISNLSRQTLSFYNGKLDFLKSFFRRDIKNVMLEFCVKILFDCYTLVYEKKHYFTLSENFSNPKEFRYCEASIYWQFGKKIAIWNFKRER